MSVRRITDTVVIAQFAGLMLVLAGHPFRGPGVALALVGLAGAAGAFVWQALPLIWRRPVAAFGAALALVLLLRVAEGMSGHVVIPALRVLPVLLLGGIGFLIIADWLRGRLLEARDARSPWQIIRGVSSRPLALWPVLVGFGLVWLAALLALGVGTAHAHGTHTTQLFLLAIVGLGTLALAGTPILVATVVGLDRDRVADAREEERLRFAAHLHDSVLQTLALIQRQAHDPDAVTRLSRRQEAELRAWLAGESGLAGATLFAAVRTAVESAEDEYSLKIELSAVGDREMDEACEALVAALKEALRNVAAHAPGAAVVVFAEIAAKRTEIFVRDSGPGFDPALVVPERRGIRDAIIGRMSAAGGSATIDSSPGEGTEVALRI